MKRSDLRPYFNWRVQFEKAAEDTCRPCFDESQVKYMCMHETEYSWHVTICFKKACSEHGCERFIRMWARAMCGVMCSRIQGHSKKVIDELKMRQDLRSFYEVGEVPRCGVVPMPIKRAMTAFKKSKHYVKPKKSYECCVITEEMKNIKNSGVYQDVKKYGCSVGV